jgi:hypothetical protein
MKNFTHLKGEFEAEGLSLNEMSALLSICNDKNVPIAIKIGGCEAKSDFEFCRKVNADIVVAPMVESSFAASKVVAMISEWRPRKMYINIETKNSIEHLDEIISVIAPHNIGIVFGRSDYSASIGRKGEVNCDAVISAVQKVANKCLVHGLPLTVGGGMNYEGYKILKNNEIIYQALNCVETRKVIFDAKSDLTEEDFLGAIELEKTILENRVNIITSEIESKKQRISQILLR